MLSTGIGSVKLPTELGLGSGWTRWRRMHEWAEAGVFDRRHTAVLDRLGDSGSLDWSRASLHSISVRAKKGGELTGPNPTDRASAAASTTCSSTPPACRWTCSSPAPTGTTACSSNRSSTACRRSRAATRGVGRSSSRAALTPGFPAA